MTGKVLFVNWRAEIRVEGVRSSGRARRIHREHAAINFERNIPAGKFCEIDLLPPVEQVGAKISPIRAKAEIVSCVLTTRDFELGVRWLSIDEAGRRQLEERMEAKGR